MATNAALGKVEELPKEVRQKALDYLEQFFTLPDGDSTWSHLRKEFVELGITEQLLVIRLLKKFFEGKTLASFLAK